MRCTGFEETTTEDGHYIWYRGEDTKHEYGVSFIVRKEATECIKSCTPISSRIISVRVSAKPKNIAIIQVRAPTNEHDDQGVDEFYEQV